MASSTEADISTFPKILILEAASVAVYLYVITIEAVTLITPKIQLYLDGYRICMYPESCDCGLPDHGPVDWSRGLTSSDWPGPRSRWFPRLVPLPESLEPHDHRIGPAFQSPSVRTWAVSSNKLKVTAIEYEAYFDPNFSNICFQRYKW